MPRRGVPMALSGVLMHFDLAIVDEHGGLFVSRGRIQVGPLRGPVALRSGQMRRPRPFGSFLRALSRLPDHIHRRGRTARQFGVALP